MHVTFNASERSTLGVEIEIGIVDTATRELACVASPILSTVGADYPEGEHPRAKHELYESTIEVITGICDTVDDARRDLTATLAELDAVMAPQGFACR
jgi:carboxylate-amine ligase